MLNGPLFSGHKGTLAKTEREKKIIKRNPREGIALKLLTRGIIYLWCKYYELFPFIFADRLYHSGEKNLVILHYVALEAVKRAENYSMLYFKLTLCYLL